jgi:truncated hemoglobin YjbI
MISSKAGADREASLYERIGAEKIERLVAAFYARVDGDPVIRPFTAKRSPARSMP